MSNFSKNVFLRLCMLSFLSFVKRLIKIRVMADLLGRFLIIELSPTEERHSFMNLFIHYNVVFHERNFLAVFVQETFQNG